MVRQGGDDARTGPEDRYRRGRVFAGDGREDRASETWVLCRYRGGRRRSSLRYRGGDPKRPLGNEGRRHRSEQNEVIPHDMLAGMKITFAGAAGTVTGSLHHLEVEGKRY